MTDERPPTSDQFINMPAQDIRAYLASGKEPPDLTDEQMTQLPPGTEYSYAQAKALAGDSTWIGKVGSLAVGTVDAAEASAERRDRLSSYDVEYREGPGASDSNYLGHDHQTLKTFVDPIDAKNVTVYADTYHDLHKLFQRLSDEMREAVGKSKQGWEGGAADSAHGYFTSLSDWSEGNSQNAQMASDIIASESSAASNAKNSMPEPIPFNMEQEMDSWGYNPFTMADKVEQSIQKMQQSQAAHEEAAQVMTQYDFELQEAGNKQPVFAEPPKFNGAGGANDTGSSGVISINDPSTSASGFVGGPVGSGGGNVPTGGGPVNVPSSPSGSVPPPVAPGVSTGVRPPGTTRPSGLAPGRPTLPPPGQRGNRNTFGPGGTGGVGVGPMPMGPGGGFGPGGGGGGVGGGGRLATGGFGPGGGGGAGGAAGPGSGAATGA
ncbi:hypothetical protein, partial [Saccharomonospora azurea]